MSKHKCIEDYYQKIYLPWISSDELSRFEIERQFDGVHEFKPQYRGDCYTADFTGSHPKAIERSLTLFKLRINEELERLTHE